MRCYRKVGPSGHLSHQSTRHDRAILIDGLVGLPDARTRRERTEDAKFIAARLDNSHEMCEVRLGYCTST
jgi:hypothetical protein